MAIALAFCGDGAEGRYLLVVRGHIQLAISRPKCYGHVIACVLDWVGLLRSYMMCGQVLVFPKTSKRTCMFMVYIFYILYMRFYIHI